MATDYSVYSLLLNKSGLDTEEKVKACLFWAFGYGFGAMPKSSLPHVWNAVHGELFIIGPYDHALETFQRIAELYKMREDAFAHKN